MAESFHFDINMVGSVADRTLQFDPHLIEGNGLKALDFPAGVALEVGMGRVMLAGQLEMVYPTLQRELAYHTPVGKILQGAVNGDLINPAAGADARQNFLGPEGSGRIS
jgi:hypothetical protein